MTGGSRWVAFLRGVSPTRAAQRNDRLRGVCEDLGFTDVDSVLASGNLLLRADDRDRAELEAALEVAWRERLGFESTSILRRCSELVSLVESDPFGGREHGPASYLLVTFVQDEVPSADLPQPPPGSAFELLGSTGRELFTVTDTTGPAGSPETMRWLESTFGTAITSRTWRTVRRVLARC